MKNWENTVCVCVCEIEREKKKKNITKYKEVTAVSIIIDTEQ